MKWLVVSVAVLVACGSPPEGRAPESAEGAILFFDEPSGKRLPFPMVKGTVNGRPTTLIVDTGAQISVVAEWLATKISLPMTEAASAQDPAGNPVPMLRADHVAIAIDRFGPLPDLPVSVIDLPPAFEKLDIGGIISPQTMAPVVIDIPRRRLSHTPVGPVKGIELPKVHVCNYESNGLAAHSLVGEGTVDSVPVVLEIDTAAESMVIVADSDAGKRVGTRPNPKAGAATGAAGRFTVQSWENVPIQIGSWSNLAFVTVAPGKKQDPCGYEGRMSIQELNQCVFVINPKDDVRITCDRVRPAAPAD